MLNLTTRSLRAALLGATLGLAGCAAVTQHSATLAPLAGAEQAIATLAAPATLTFDTGYSRALRAGSRWQRIGALPQGSVYKPVGDVLTVEGAHIHEAYLVLDGQSVAGFYLPAERSFSPLRARVALQFQ